MECMTSRAIYERAKKAFLGKQTFEASQRQEAVEARKIPDSDIVDLINTHINEKVVTTHNEMDLAWICFVAEKYLHVIIGESRARRIRTLWKIKQGDGSEGKKIV